MPQVRQEINILDAVLTATSGGTATSNEIVQVDTTQYINPKYYFEIVADSTLSITDTVTLRQKGTATDDATCTIPLGTTSATRIRSSSFIPGTTLDVAAGQTEYVVFINTSTGANTSVKAARIIVIDNPTTITSTETQIEVGGQGGTTYTSTTAVALTNPKYWLYTAANWNGTIAFYAEVTYKTASSNTATITLQEDNGSFASWADKVTIVSATSSTTATRLRSASFTPTNGRNYRIAVKSSTTKSSVTIYNAKVIVDQSPTIIDSYNLSNNDSIFSPSTTNTALGQSFTGNGGTLGGVIIGAQNQTATAGNVNAIIYATTGTFGTSSVPTGAALATSDTVNLTTWPSRLGIVRFNFSGGNQITLTNATHYFLSIEFTATLNIGVAVDSTAPTAPGNFASRPSGVWTANNTEDMGFYVLQTSTAPSQLEPQYLLLNTVNTSTGLQAYQTLVDKTEWSGVSLTGKHAIDSNNASNAAKLTDITASADVTSSTVTGANQQISGNIWANITSGDQIDVNVTNSTGAIAASRIIVAVSPPAPISAGSTLPLMGVG